MAGLASGLAVTYPTEAVIEATTPEVVRKKSLDGDYGIQERVYGIAARTKPGVTFEEYTFWAEIEREMEREENRKYQAARGPTTFTSLLKNRFSHGVHHENKVALEKEEAEKSSRALQATEESDQIVGKDEKAPTAIVAAPPPDFDSSLRVTDAEWRTAARALRTASWGTICFLVTTDILGWSSCPFVFASVGFGPGVALYVVFGIFAGISGWAIWKTFMGLDSSRYPMMSFGDPFFRIYGPKTRHFINIMQSIQQFLSVAVLILGNGTVLAEVASNKICFIVCMLICMIIGMVSGLMRSLQHVGWLANLCVWMNIISFIIIMVASSNYPIYYPAVTKSTLIKTIEPVKTFAGPPPDAYQMQAYGFAAQFNGVDSMVYAYSGAIIFVAFLAEMRHPWDFWKGIFLAQTFICFVYILFGAFVYSQYGQYSASTIGTVIQPFALQTVGNVIGLITGLIACLLYFNIGMKTVYLEVFQEILHFPPITTKKGQLVWCGLGPCYWIIAFVLAASVPNLNAIVGLVGGLFSLNFTYSIPAIMFLGYNVTRNASLPGEGFDPKTEVTTRHDAGYKRWVRGFKKQWWLNTIMALYFMAGLACSGMGSWAAIEGAIAVFGPGGTVATSWGCAAPV
ncbi:hypothetical protein LTR36_007429 [Oleoguttula mirabilis]|uniref:Amino acid transporter transmembrane domain-containing protein n=1 Tax=Oleoguttula mirabilis TaxID=1507867 RepID=A0AAV9J9H7_9PEZI|nr:hypothetical protein LTR36_007429 [Oleoguttula mirabilis]